MKNDPDAVFVNIRYHLAWNVVHRRSSFPEPQNAFEVVNDAFFDSGSAVGSFVSLLWLAPDHVHVYLNGACTAWNISLLPAAKRKDAVDKFITQYKAANPDVDDVENVRHDIELLIKEKLRLYPNEKRAIASAEFIEDAGKERIIVASISKNVKHP
jgi:hypothetical protein